MWREVRLSCGGPFPTNQQTRRGRPCLPHTRRTLSATENTECPCFCEWRCQFPKGVNDYFVIMTLHFTMLDDLPTCRRRLTGDPATVRVTVPRCLSCSHPSSLIDGQSAYCTRSALPPASVCLCICLYPSLYPTQSHLSLTGLAPPLLSAAVAPDWSSGAPLTQHASGRPSLSLFSPNATS